MLASAMLPHVVVVVGRMHALCLAHSEWGMGICAKTPRGFGNGELLWILTVFLKEEQHVHHHHRNSPYL